MALAHEKERQRRQLAYDEDFHQRKLSQLDVDSRHPSRAQPEDDDEGEIAPEAKEITLLYPAIPSKNIAAIFDGTFDPKDLYKLHRTVSLDVDDEDEISIVGGKLLSKRRKGTAKDYPYPSVWSRAFIQYVSVVSCFDKYSGLVRPLLEFYGQIMELSQSYQWEAVLTLALTFHKERIVLGIMDFKAWDMPSAFIDKHLRGKLRVKPSTTPKPHASNLSSMCCIRWNLGLCNSSSCPRKHACRRCGQDHKESEHSDKNHGDKAQKERGPKDLNRT